MKELLTAIKAQLQDDADLSYIDDSDIFITPDENIIPVTINFPAIGLKDGAINRIIDSSTGWEVVYTVYLIIYQVLTAGETPIIGQASPLIYGVLDIAENIITSLNENTLSISGMMEKMAYPGDEMESETTGFEDLVLQKKKILMIYHKWEDRP